LEILRIDKIGYDFKIIDQLCKEAQKIARPKFLYEVSLVDYENCRFCSRKNCPNRRAFYVPDPYEKKYGLQK
jgi:hypothetical protein